MTCLYFALIAWLRPCFLLLLDLCAANAVISIDTLPVTYTDCVTHRCPTLVAYPTQSSAPRTGAPPSSLLQLLVRKRGNFSSTTLP